MAVSALEFFSRPSLERFAEAVYKLARGID